jgi:hypothetical protein
LAVLDAIPPGPFMAIDAAAWRYLSGRQVIVTPAEFELGLCLGMRYGARSIVLESAHFREWDAVYVSESWPMLGQPVVRDTFKIFPMRADAGCSIGVRP